MSFHKAEIGFSRDKALLNLFKGLLFGLCVFFIAYTTEIFIAKARGNFTGLKIYVSAYV